MPEVQQTVLRFALKTTESPMTVFDRFHPQGKTVLNRTEWMGKAARTCGVTNVSSYGFENESEEPFEIAIEVSHRPKGFINYVGKTRYDGWTMMLLDRKKDGTLLDGHGNPLPTGSPKVYLPYEVYEDIDFNEIQFGTFLGESPIEDLTRIDYDSLHQRWMRQGTFGGSISKSFMAPHKHRQTVKIILSGQPSGIATDRFRTKLIIVRSDTPNLRQVVLDHVQEIIAGFIEGRYSLKTFFGRGDEVFVDLEDILVDCTPNEQGKASRFNCLREYVDEEDLRELALSLMATYEVKVTLVGGKETGFVLGRLSNESAS